MPKTDSKTDSTTIDAYIAAQPEAAQGVLEAVRGALRKAIPGADEVISYRIPAFKLDGRVVIYFAAWKNHHAIYPATDAVVAALGKELARYEVSKGTIRFPFSEPVPVRLIGRIAKLRAEEVAAHLAAKRTKARPGSKRVALESVKKKPARKTSIEKKSAKARR